MLTFTSACVGIAILVSFVLFLCYIAVVVSFDWKTGIEPTAMSAIIIAIVGLVLGIVLYWRYTIALAELRVEFDGKETQAATPKAQVPPSWIAICADCGAKFTKSRPDLHECEILERKSQENAAERHATEEQQQQTTNQPTGNEANETSEQVKQKEEEEKEEKPSNVTGFSAF